MVGPTYVTVSGTGFPRVHSSYRRSGRLHVGYPLLDAEHSLCTAPWSGTPCRTTSAHSSTMSPLDRVWKPGFSPDTSVFSALETFVIIALYKSTFTYHTVPLCFRASDYCYCKSTTIDTLCIYRCSGNAVASATWQDNGDYDVILYI